MSESARPTPSERAWGEGPEGWHDVCAYIAADPALTALLMEADLMPYHKRDTGSKRCDYIFAIVNHWREREIELERIQAEHDTLGCQVAKTGVYAISSEKPLRDSVLEEAAKICESRATIHSSQTRTDEALECAKDIRALKSAAPQAPCAQSPSNPGPSNRIAPTADLNVAGPDETAPGVQPADAALPDKQRDGILESDVLRLHEEKMKFFERTIDLERELAARSGDFYSEVRIIAEGSDWKRDAGETLAQWVKRSAASSAIGRRNEQPETLPALPGQKALTFLMRRDTSDQQADALIEAMKQGNTTFIPTPISELFFHQLRLRVAQDPTLIDKIAVYYLTANRQWQEVGLRFEDELRWPVGLCNEAWNTEIAINRIREAARKNVAPEGATDKATDRGATK